MALCKDAKERFNLSFASLLYQRVNISRLELRDEERGRNGYVSADAELLCEGRAVVAVDAMPSAVRWTKDGYVIAPVAIVIARHGQVVALTELHRDSLIISTVQDIPSVG